MNRLLLASMLLLLAWTSQLHSGDKSRFDMNDPAAITSLSKTAGGVGGSRSLLIRAVSEASLIDGGYFTLGTNQGADSGTLDDKCTITYGHPYAKTSYPILNIGGDWMRPEDVFSDVSTTSPTAAGDSLTLVWTKPGVASMRFTIRIDALASEKIHIAATLTNLAATAQTLGAGLALDPAIGKGGDCSLRLGTLPALVSDTVYSATPILAQPIVMNERSSAAGGVAIECASASSQIRTLIVTNWDATHGEVRPIYSIGTGPRTLYDALVRMFWTPVSVPANGSLREELVVTVRQPNFGTGIFTRCDVPQTQSIENGIPFPRQLTGTFSAMNAATSQMSTRTVEYTLSLPSEIQTAAVTKSAAIQSVNPSYIQFPLTIKSLFEDKVVVLTAICKENGVVLDSLVHPFRICKTPVSDTGLVVTIDSVIIQRHPKMAFTFDVQKKFPQQFIFGLEPENVFLYENLTRINTFTLGKDTTGGIGSVDIVFVLDVTGSMSGSINGVKNNIIEFADSLMKRGLDYRLGMVTFLDAVENVYAFDTSARQFKTTVAAQFAHGGGDGPENSLDALFAATQMAFRPTAHKVFIWITDITYHEKDWATQRSKQDVVQQLLAVDAVVHAIGPNSYQTDWYHPITQPTGGNFYSIDGNFRDILLDIGSLKNNNRYMILYTSPLPQPSVQKDIRLTIHYAGLGGTAGWSYLSPAVLRAAPAGEALVCYPNPFNPQTTIRFAVPSGAHGVVVIYNMLGQEVNRFAVSGSSSGPAQIVWNACDANGRGVAAGLYLIRSTVFSASQERLSTDVVKALLIK